MEQIVLATGNKGKIREFSEAFSHLSIDCVPVKEVISVEEPEETGTTFMENALLKARYYAQMFLMGLQVYILRVMQVIMVMIMQIMRN